MQSMITTACGLLGSNQSVDNHHVKLHSQVHYMKKIGDKHYPICLAQQQLLTPPVQVVQWQWTDWELLSPITLANAAPVLSTIMDA